MYAKLIIDGNAVYEIDEACLLRQNQDKKKRGGKTGTGKTLDRQGRGRQRLWESRNEKGRHLRRLFLRKLLDSSW